MLPRLTGNVFGSKPMIACAITLLPEPDSPTRQRISLLLYLKRHVADGLRTVPSHGQRDGQVLDLEHAHTRFAIFGSSVSRRPSPRMLTASTVAARNTPGKNTLCG